MTVDRHLDGVLTYGMTGYVATPECPDLIPENCPYDSLDTYPSLLISAAYYAEGTQDWKWAIRRWKGLRHWVDKMLALDVDGNGLIEYPLSGNSGTWATPSPTPCGRPIGGTPSASAMKTPTATPWLIAHAR